MKARKMDRPATQIASVNGEKLGRANGNGKRRRKSIRPQSPNATKQKRKVPKGQVSETPPDELMPVVPVSDDPTPAGAASIINYAALCKELYPAYLVRIKEAELRVREAVQQRGTVCTTTNGNNHNGRGRPIGERQ